MSRRGSERLIADLQIKYIAKQQRKTYTITQRVKQIHAQTAVKQTTIRGSAGSAIDSYAKCAEKKGISENTTRAELIPLEKAKE